MLLSRKGKGLVDEQLGDLHMSDSTQTNQSRWDAVPWYVLDEDWLASSLVTNKLIDAYFLLYNTSNPILHERSFRESYEAVATIPDKSSWHLVFYTVLAIGAYVSNTSPSHTDTPFYLAARARMSTHLLESGTLVGVQAFLLMVCSDQCQASPHGGRGRKYLWH